MQMHTVGMTSGMADSMASGMEASVRASLAGLDEVRDQAAAELALTYARELDAGCEDIAKIGPALLACLAALLLTPAARAAAKGVPGASDKPKSRLDEIAERRARKSRAADLDAGTA
jgi:hypothetical protein